MRKISKRQRGKIKEELVCILNFHLQDERAQILKKVSNFYFSTLFLIYQFEQCTVQHILENESNIKTKKNLRISFCGALFFFSFLAYTEI